MIGAGQKTWHAIDTSRTPVEALVDAAAAAIADTGSSRLVHAIDAVAMVRFIADTTPGIGALFPRNPGSPLAQRLGIRDAHVLIALH